MQTLAVVPIFITAGSAVLPTIVAAIAGTAALILRPRDLVIMCRRRPLPWAAAAFFLAATAVVYWTWPRRPNSAGPKLPAATDWAAVARQIIARQEMAALSPLPLREGVGGGVPAPGTNPVDPPAVATATTIVEGRTYARPSADDGPSPLGLKPLWAYTPEDTMFLATPAVAGNRVFAAGTTSSLGDFSGLLACLDADTGKPIWETSEVNGEPLKACFSSPAVTADGKSVIIGQGFHQDRNCALLCFDAATGKLRWSAASTEHIESSPAIVGDVVVVGVGAIEDHAGRPTGDPGYLMAVEISTGKTLWKHPVIDAESSPAIGDDGTVYVGSGLNGEAVVAVNYPLYKSVAPGFKFEHWKTPVGLSATATISLAGDLVIAGAGNGDFAHSAPNPKGAVIALDQKTGAVKWRTELSDAVLGPTAFRDGLLVAGTRTGEVVAMNVADGTIRWRTEPAGPSPILAGCAITTKYAYALSASGTLAVLDLADGHVIEKLATNDPARPGVALASAAPQVAGGQLYVGTETGGVRCYLGTKTLPANAAGGTK